MARSDWNIKDVLFYMDDHEQPSIFLDVYEYANIYSKCLPIVSISEMLKLSEQRFVDMLNEPFNSKKHLITNYEEYFRDGKHKFNKYEIFGIDNDIVVELADFEYWLDDNYELLKNNRATPKECPAQGTSSPEWLAMQKKVAALEAALADSSAENDKLRAENEELKNVALRGGEDGKNGQDEEFPAEYEDHGLFTVVAKLVYARAPVSEIMAALDEEKEFLSQRENGYFFHPNPAGKSPSTLRNSVKNTLKKRVAKGSQ